MLIFLNVLKGSCKITEPSNDDVNNLSFFNNNNKEDNNKKDAAPLLKRKIIIINLTYKIKTPLSS